MSYEPITITSQGGPITVSLPFPFLSRDHVKAEADSLPVPFTWTGPAQITTDAIVPSGAVLRVFRDTPINEALVDFEDVAVLTAADLDKQSQQLRYHQQEVEASAVRREDLFVGLGADLKGIERTPQASGPVFGDASNTFVTAFAARPDRLYVPPEAYFLASDVVVGGNISWRKSRDAFFSGAGKLLTPDLIGFNYTPSLGNVDILEARGTVSSPVPNAHPIAVYSKRSSAGNTEGAPNATVVYQHYKRSSANDARGQGIYAEAIDEVGGIGSFVEGGRFHGIAKGDAKAYGLVAYAQTNVAGSLNAVGLEAEVARVAGVDAALPTAWTNGQQLDAMALATARYGKQPMAGFLLNPYNTVKVRVGFGVLNSFAAQGTAQGLVSFASFFTNENDVPHGFYARNVTYSLVSGPNNIPIRMATADETAELNVLNLEPDNYVSLGTEAEGIRLRQNTIFTVPDSSSPGATVGELSLQRTSDTQLTLKLRGSDGIVRTTTLNLS